MMPHRLLQILTAIVLVVTFSACSDVKEREIVNPNYGNC